MLGQAGSESYFPAMTGDPRRERNLGIAYGCAAYASWGFFPIYLKATAQAPVVEVLCHRVFWAVVMLLALTWHQGQLSEVVGALKRRRVLAVLSASTVMIAINWLVYIFSVVHNRMLESSFGYYINPLVNVLLGVLFLRERLPPLVRVAVGIAAVGVLWLGVCVGRAPWISLTVAFSFGFYGLLRKVAPVGALIGLTVETLLLLPFVAAYLIVMVATGRATFLSGNHALDALLVMAGPVTAVPLLLFAAAARRLPLSTMGFLQYLSPTLQFLLAVVVYGELLDRPRLAAFACIWTALALFAFHSVRRRVPEPVVDA
jgi:chloramphenicol-sensitive protein RarD